MTGDRGDDALERAMEAVKEALSKDPSNGELHHTMAALLILSGQREAAVSHVRRAEALGVASEILRSHLDPHERDGEVETDL
jgi:Tfp pilus assembly protein PilF